VRQVHPSGGNFLLVDLEGPPSAASDVHTRLLTLHGIDVKDVTERFGDLVPRLRIAVRAQDDNDRLLAALASLR
jgi:histidinol-phosphate/aromatic aminotransferase/cobyric acid decarboxylase-like protein